MVGMFCWDCGKSILIMASESKLNPFQTDPNIWLMFLGYKDVRSVILASNLHYCLKEIDIFIQ